VAKTQFNSIQFIHTYSHNVNLQEWKKGKQKEQRKWTSSYICTRYYFEILIVRSGQRSKAFELATTTVQLIVRGSYLQNIHEVITI